MNQQHSFSTMIRFLLGAALFFTISCSQSSSSTTTPTTQIVLVGESHASGAQAAIEVNNIISNASAAGCKAISVGGYGAAAETQVGLKIGIPVLLECPVGTKLNPNGTVQ